MRDGRSVKNKDILISPVRFTLEREYFLLPALKLQSSTEGKIYLKRKHAYSDLNASRISSAKNSTLVSSNLTFYFVPGGPK